jgi:hypothetical protein
MAGQLVDNGRDNMFTIEAYELVMQLILETRRQNIEFSHSHLRIWRKTPGSSDPTRIYFVETYEVLIIYDIYIIGMCSKFISSNSDVIYLKI